jgi:hypothetical protein
MTPLLFFCLPYWSDSNLSKRDNVSQDDYRELNPRSLEDKEGICEQILPLLRAKDYLQHCSLTYARG